MRAWFVRLNMAVCALFLALVWLDNRREWKGYQEAFRKLELNRVTDQKLVKLAKGRPVEIQQMVLSDLKRVDRCTTCHQGILRPEFADAPQPFRTHPGSLLKSHPPEKFGCTVCHHGQGMGTTVEAAHGDVEHWDQPLLRGGLAAAACAKCHTNLSTPGMEVLLRAEEHFTQRGCIGCHAVDGYGGKVSVDLVEAADKEVEKFDFVHVPVRRPDDPEALFSGWRGRMTRDVPPYRTTANYLHEHFLNPQAVNPPRPEVGVPYASPMPNYRMPPSEARDLTVLMLSFGSERKRIPRGYLANDRGPAPFWVDHQVSGGSAEERGRQVFVKYGCLGCHGPNGGGWPGPDGLTAGVANYNSQGGRVPMLTHVNEGYTLAELKDRIRYGVQPVDKKDPDGPTPPLYMQRFGERMSERELDEVAAYLMSLAPKKKEEAW